MYYSVWDAFSQQYFYYVSRAPIAIDYHGYYNEQTVPMPWQNAQILLPADATPAGSGPMPRGAICHPEQLDVPLCSDEPTTLGKLAWVGLIYAVKKLFF